VSYREFTPVPTLAPWLECLWERTGDGGAPVRVLPDGCIDIVWTESSATRLIGPNTTAFLAPVAAGRRVVGVRLRPGAAPALLGVDAERLRDRRLPLADVLGDPGARLADALDAAPDPARALGEWLTTRALRAAVPDPVVVRAVAQLSDDAGRVGGLADELGLSERTVRRRMTAAVGYGPKRLARVLRLGRALGAARAGEELASAAFTAGYVDQAHFSHDCRKLAGIGPAALLGR
jgi:AraC-like DNA-binding protein